MFAPSSHNDTDHKDKATHDLIIAEQLLTNGHSPDWVVICSFYTALHCVDAYAHKLGITTFEPRLGEKISAHGKRARFVKDQLNAHFASYNRLYDRSMQARYDPQYYRLMFPNVPSSAVKDAKNFMGLI